MKFQIVLLFSLVAFSFAAKELTNLDEEQLEKEEKQIEKHNEKFENGDSSFSEKSNPYEGMSKEEFEKEREGAELPPKDEQDRGMGAFEPEHPSDRYDEESEQVLAALMADRAYIPSSYDSRSYGYVSPVKSQQQCGSCAAFSAAALIETCLYKATYGMNGHRNLAEQFLVDCGFNGNSMNGCNGAWVHAYQDYIANNFNELPHEYDDKYLNTKPKLTCDRSIPLHHMGATVTSRTYTYSCNKDMMKQMIMKYGAVSTAMYASDNHFKSYSSGVINWCSSNKINHAVTAVGWDDSQGVWIVKNSWGANWGEQGFFRMKYDTCGIGGACAAVECKSNNVAVSAVPTTTQPPPPPPGQTCDISKLYGNSGITGNYNLNTNMYGTNYYAELTCKNSVCQARTAKVSNACVYICGRDPC